jgi:hypothetical protein
VDPGALAEQYEADEGEDESGSFSGHRHPSFPSL